MATVDLHKARSSLQSLVSLGVPLLLDDVERKGKWLPDFVQQEMNRFLDCGDFRTESFFSGLLPDEPGRTHIARILAIRQKLK